MTALTTPKALFQEPTFDFEARIALGAAARGIGDVALVVATLDRITDGDYPSWFDAWTTQAAALARRAQEATAAGRRRTAQWAWLTASEYYAKALAALDGLPDDSALAPTFAEQERCWQAYIDAADGRFVRVPIPYADTTLPGYLLRPDDTGTARPTLVIVNGSDGSLAGLVAHAGAEALARGWNAFVFDGPGQQSALFQHGIHFRPDWEAVLTPVLDTLVGRPDVNGRALLGYGVSQGGFWLPRALAFEHRLVAAVADGGVVDVSRSWTEHLPPPLLDLLHAGDRTDFNAAMAGAGGDPAAARTLAFRARPYGITDMFDLFTEVLRYRLEGDLVGRIRTPLLITDPEDEQFFPGQSRELFDLLPGRKELLPFARDTGAAEHCEPLGRRLTNLDTHDWLADQLG